MGTMPDALDPEPDDFLHGSEEWTTTQRPDWPHAPPSVPTGASQGSAPVVAAYVTRGTSCDQTDLNNLTDPQRTSANQLTDLTDLRWATADDRPDRYESRRLVSRL